MSWRRIDELLAKARLDCRQPEAVQRWDVKGYQIPGGTPSNPKVAQMLAIAPSILRSKTQGTLPAPEKILCAAVEGAQVDFDTAHLIETRYFTELTTGQISKNLIGTFWFQLNEINAGGSRPQGFALCHAQGRRARRRHDGRRDRLRQCLGRYRRGAQGHQPGGGREGQGPLGGCWTRKSPAGR
jgi:hypothetical protein